MRVIFSKFFGRASRILISGPPVRSGFSTQNPTVLRSPEIRILPVEVGTALASRPPHGSGRAELPHPALALGSDASSLTYALHRWCHVVSGSVSGTCSRVVHSPWPMAFPPSPPPQAVSVCSETLLVLCHRPTACVRTSSACVLRLPDAAHHLHGQTQALPVPAQGASVHVRGL